jgi:hypothetical protein
MGRTLVKMIVPAAALLALACGTKGQGDQAARDSLNRDLEMVSAKGIELASAQGAPTTQIVSAIERTPVRAPRQGAASRAPRKAQVPAPAPIVAPEAEPAVAEVVEPAVVAQAPEPEPEAQAPAPEPTVVPVSYPTGGSGEIGRGGGRRGGGLGGIFGVIIRGGSAGVDHCERHPNGGGMVLGGSTIAINQRMPVIRPTF